MNGGGRCQGIERNSGRLLGLGPSNRAWLVLLFVEEKVERRAVFERSRVLEIPSVKLLLRGEVRAGKVM